MKALARNLVVALAVLAFAGNLMQVHPCVDDDECAVSEAASSSLVACPASDAHHDPSPPAHVCGCMCHVPGLAVHAAPVARRLPLAAEARSGATMALSLGFRDSPFRPPRS